MKGPKSPSGWRNWVSITVSCNIIKNIPVRCGEICVFFMSSLIYTLHNKSFALPHVRCKLFIVHPYTDFTSSFVFRASLNCHAVEPPDLMFSESRIMFGSLIATTLASIHFDWRTHIQTMALSLNNQAFERIFLSRISCCTFD